jgi:hypothetical protein
MLFILQTVIFMVFIVFTTIYYWDRSAHIHFNRPIEILNFQSIFSMIMTYLFIAFLIITLIYPILLMIQIYYMRKIKGIGKNRYSYLFCIFYPSLRFLLYGRSTAVIQ